MLKLMKYEFRKMRTMLMIMGIALVVLEAAFLIGDKIKDSRVTAISLSLLTILIFVAYVYILIAGIAGYARELNDKTGYMTFMVPVGPWGIVGSKLLFTVLAALVVTALFGCATYYDYARLFGRLEGSAELYRQVDMTFTLFTGSLGGAMTLNRVLLAIGYTVGSMLISIVLAMCTAFLAITLAATLLQNRKGFVRGLVIVLFFFGLNWLSSWVTSKITIAGLHIAEDAAPETVAALARGLGVSALIQLAFAVTYAGASAWLLDRKVSL